MWREFSVAGIEEPDSAAQVYPAGIPCTGDRNCPDPGDSYLHRFLPNVASFALAPPESVFHSPS